MPLTPSNFTRFNLPFAAAMLLSLAMPGCDSSSGGPAGAGAGPGGGSGESTPPADGDGSLTFKSDVEPVRSVEEAMAGVFIPPFEDCREPLDGEPGEGPDGQVCTPVAISGATEPGRYFPDYADCDVVRRQRPYYADDPAATPPTDDPRLSDDDYLAELEWVKSQIAASGCTCCHDSRTVPASQWDIAAGPLWLDTLSDEGLALFAGLADSSVLGAYPPEDAFGFSRDTTGIPTTDPERMQAFLSSELERRGRDEAWGRSVPPFGGPIYENSVAEPTDCEAGEGITEDGRVQWTGGSARYVYLQMPEAKNPGVPPNLDLPEGTLWRLDVLASEPALESGIAYGETPDGSFQVVPEASAAPSLEPGTQYKLVVLFDVGIPRTNCLFEYGAVGQGPSTPTQDAGTPMPTEDGGTPMPTEDGGSDQGGSTEGGAATCDLEGGDARGFGAPCTTAEDCPCTDASYCAQSPFDSQGYCTAPLSSCDGDTSVCPDGWGCFDVSNFSPGEPAICSKP